MEGPPKPQTPKAETPQSEQTPDVRAKLVQAAELREKVEAAGDQLSPEQRESFLFKIEAEEARLRGQLAELNDREKTVLEAVKTEKSDWDWGTISNSYEKAVTKVNKLSAGLGIASAGTFVVGMAEQLSGTISLEHIQMVANLGMAEAAAAAAVFAIGRGYALTRAKVSEWIGPPEEPKKAFN